MSSTVAGWPGCCAAGAEAITTWVSTHFSKETAGGETVYNLTRPVSS